MRIIDLNEYVGRFFYRMKPDSSIESDAFSKIYQPGGVGSGFAAPMRCIHNALIWIFLKWHQEKNVKIIQDSLSFVIERAIQLNTDTKVTPRLREAHDHFLIQLAILNSDKEWTKKVCDSVIVANDQVKNYQYMQAWTGILTYRIRDEQDNVEKQYEIMKQWKPDRICAWPTNKLVETFVNRDWKEFNKVLKRSCEKQWKIGQKDMAVYDNADRTDKIFNIEYKNIHFFWPWVEATFAKLAYLDGAEIKYDSFWLPKDMIIS